MSDTTKVLVVWEDPHGTVSARPGRGARGPGTDPPRIYMEDWGGDLMELASFLGHRSVETTRDSYQHFSQSAAVRMGRKKVYGEG